jgi:hypothetical protein
MYLLGKSPNGKGIMSNVVFPDGSQVEQDETGIRVVSGEMAMDAYRLKMVISMLEMEIKFPGMKMSRHLTALKGAENISGLTFGRGVSGRKKALAWAVETYNALLASAE